MKSPHLGWVAPFLFACGVLMCATGAAQESKGSTSSGQLEAGGISRGAEPTGNETETKPKASLSPLHTFLGIDPTTDEFTRPGAQKKPAVKAEQGPVASEAKAAEAPTLNANQATPSVPTKITGEPDDLLAAENAQKLRAAIVKAIEQGDQSSLASLLSGLPQGTGYERLLETSRRYSYLLYLFLLVYPLSIVSAEFFRWLARRADAALVARERAYQASRARLRLLLATVSTATIAMFWWGTEHDFWFEQRTQFATFVTAVLVLLAASGLLRFVIRRAAARYPVLMIRELQLKQVQLQQEVDELQKRLHTLRFAGGLS